MNKFLRYFYLRNCKFEDQGAKAIGDLLAGNSTIQELEIFNCGITEIGGDAIKEALKNNFTIGKLSIGDNKLKPSSIEQIQQSVIFNTQYNQMKVSIGKPAESSRRKAEPDGVEARNGVGQRAISRPLRFSWQRTF